MKKSELISLIETTVKQIISEAAVDEKNYQTVIKLLSAKNIPCTVKLFKNGSITIACGFDYPDSLADKIDSILLKTKIKYNIAADASGEVVNSQRIAGGPKRY